MPPAIIYMKMDGERVSSGRCVWFTRVPQGRAWRMASYRPRLCRFLGADQANGRIIDSAFGRTWCGRSKVYVNLDRFGKHVGPRVPVGPRRSRWRGGRLQRGDLVLRGGFGAELAWGIGSAGGW